ncbi:protein FANTASTIC FOUR 3-like isoform X2 [Benincasa hispida]|uniref:protein FANTASTIC FOUR 3-like isoform X2 n=1 Tax=Benincasa hispida TaxID=102211 RepID=UPI0018FFEA84|nr:protein FANTASTIC FOUR 3-like isoform X2 [Benincasa hispida]
MVSSLEKPFQSTTLMLRKEPSYPTSKFSNRKCEEEVEANSKHGENGEGWSFLESLSNGHQENKVYVHHSSTKLSKKSLEMCTESLGSESGSDMGENDISLLTLEVDDSRRYSTLLTQKKAIRKYITFPPPLTSISGSTGVRVKSYREDGRLVLKAMVCSTSPSSYFQAERSHGRLKLQLVKHIEKRVKEEDGEEVEEELNFVDDDGEEMGMENFGRLRNCSNGRCKQGRHKSKELLNWEPLWVST